MSSLKNLLANIDSAKWGTRLVGFIFVFLYIQSLLMGLNRESGNDFTQLMKYADSFLNGTAENGWSTSFYSSLFPVFVFAPLYFLPIWLAHSLWYLLLLFLFVFPIYHAFNIDRKFDMVLFALVFLPFVEVLQSNMLNGQMSILPLASLLGFYVSLKNKDERLGSFFLGLTVSLRFEAVVFLLFPLVQRNWKQLAGAVVVIFVLSVFLPFAVSGSVVLDFYSSLYLSISNSYSMLGDEYLGVLNLPLHMAAVIVVVGAHIYLLKKRVAEEDALFLYIPLMLLIFSPLFKTYYLISLFPLLLTVASSIKGSGEAVWKNSSLYLYLLVLFSYAVARAMEEPKAGYLISVGFSFVAVLFVLLRREEKA